MDVLDSHREKDTLVFLTRVTKAVRLLLCGPETRAFEYIAISRALYTVLRQDDQAQSISILARIISQVQVNGIIFVKKSVCGFISDTETY